MWLLSWQYYQALFCDGECFIHVVSLLNGNLDVTNGEMLVLNVLKTLTCLLSQNDASKVPVCSSSVLVFGFHLWISRHTSCTGYQSII